MMDESYVISADTGRTHSSQLDAHRVLDPINHLDKKTTEPSIYQQELFAGHTNAATAVALRPPPVKSSKKRSKSVEVADILQTSSPSSAQSVNGTDSTADERRQKKAIHQRVRFEGGCHLKNRWRIIFSIVFAGNPRRKTELKSRILPWLRRPAFKCWTMIRSCWSGRSASLYMRYQTNWIWLRSRFVSAGMGSGQTAG